MTNEIITFVCVLVLVVTMQPNISRSSHGVILFPEYIEDTTNRQGSGIKGDDVQVQGIKMISMLSTKCSLYICI